MAVSRFISGMSVAINAMLDYREALGFSRAAHESSLLNFDRYCIAHYPENDSITQDMALSWISEQMDKPKCNIGEKATTIRLLGQYLSAIGQKSYILPKSYVSKKAIFTPYIFSDSELASLFNAADNLRTADSVEQMIAPVLFRLIYTCGLRPNEGRELKRSAINFGTGEVLITKTKRKKERIVVMSNDMLDLCINYDNRREAVSPVSEYFFPRKDGQPYTAVQVERIFKKCWALANPAISPEELPGVRIYDLRHRHASAVLNRWLDEKRNLYAMLPYLRAYMGHDQMSETAYYIHILPENIVKNAGIDWAALEGIIPEVDVWVK